jgi:hypothetical protein
MRSQQRDNVGLTTFSGYAADVAAGSGISGDVSYTYTRTGTGLYVFNFNLGLVPQGVIATPGASSRQCGVDSLGPGTFRVGASDATGVATNHPFNFTCTAIDKRTTR